jgi:hypothetical protein
VVDKQTTTVQRLQARFQVRAWIRLVDKVSGVTMSSSVARVPLAIGGQWVLQLDNTVTLTVVAVDSQKSLQQKINSIKDQQQHKPSKHSSKPSQAIENFDGH